MFNKKGEIVTLIVVGLIFLVGSLFMSDSSITGAAITADVLDVDVPEDENLSVIDIIERAISNEVEQVVIEAVIEESIDVIEIQAACNSWPCSCGDSITGSVTMTSNLSCTSDSLFFGADDVIFDCDGYTLNSTTLLSWHAGEFILNATGRDNLSIKNCNVVGKKGISFGDVNNSDLFNNTVYTSTSGFDFSNSYNNLLNSSNVSSSLGIYFGHSYFNNVTNNFILGLVYSTSTLIDLFISSNNTIFNNYLDNGSIGIEVGYNSLVNNISYNNISTIFTKGIYENNDADFITRTFYPYVSNSSTYIGNNIIINSSNAFYIENGTNRLVEENNFINSSTYGLYFSEIGTNNVFLNNNFTNNEINFDFTLNSNLNQNLTSNLIDGETLYYFYQNNNSRINGSDVGAVYLIDSDNVSLNDFIVNSSSNYYSVFVKNSYNLTTRNITLELAAINLYLSDVNHSFFNESVINDASSEGIFIEDSFNNTFLNVNLSNNSNNLGVSVTNDIYYDHNFTSVIVESDVLSYLFNKSSETFTDIGGFYVILGTDVVINGATFTGFNSKVINSSHVNITNAFSSASTIPINITNSFNISIFNFTTNNTQFVSDRYGINLFDVNNTTIYDSYFGNISYGVFAKSSNNLSVINNRFVDGELAIQLGSTILNNNITNFSSKTVNSQSYVIGPRSNSLVSGNVVQSSCYNDTDGFVVYLSGNNHEIVNNLFNNTLVGDFCTGVRVSSGSNLINISYNNFSHFEDGVLLGEGNVNVSNNIFDDCDEGVVFNTNFNIFTNNIFKNGVTGVSMSQCNNNYFNNNTYANNNISFKIDSNAGTSINNMSNEKFYNSSSAIFTDQINFGNIFFVSENVDNLFFNPTFEGNTLDLNQSATAGVETTYIVNATGFNQSKISVGATRKTFLQWYVDVNVSNSTGEPVSNVNVSAFKSDGSLDYTNLSGSDGIARLKLTELYFKGDIAFVLTPHTITAIKGNYTSNSTSLNMRNQTYAEVNLTINKFGCGQTIYSDFILDGNLSCSSNGIVVGSDDVVINGQGNYIFGANNGDGVVINGKNGLNITNLFVSNFTNGIYFNDSNNSFVNVSNILNGSYGVVYNDSDGGLVLNSVVANNSVNQFVLDTSQVYNNSILNMSFDANNSSVINTGNLFKKWYVEISVTMNATVPLQGANVTAYLNNSVTVEQSKLSDVSGVALLDLKESKFNATGEYFITPHNLSAFLNTTNDFSQNSTSFNLTLTNSTSDSLSLVFDCTVPTSSSTVSEDTTFCPGTYDVDEITIDDTGFLGSVSLVCDDTVFSGGGTSIKIQSQTSTIDVDGCSFSGSSPAIDIDFTDSFTLGNLSFNNCGDSDIEVATCVDIFSSDSGVLENFTLNDASIKLSDANSMRIFKGSVLNSGTGILLSGSANVNISNVTFNGNGRSIKISEGSIDTSDSTIIYHNTFIDSGQSHIQNDESSNNTYELNQSVEGGYIQGNAYDDFCNKGTDSDGDGYADTGSSSNYPYSSSTSSYVFDDFASGSLVDYHPLIQTCVTEVQVGSTVSVATASTASTGGSAPPAPAVAVAPPAVVAPTMSGDEAAEAIEVEVVDQREDEGNLVAVFEVKNNNPDKAMLLDPDLADQLENPNHAVPFLTTYPLRSLPKGGVVGSSMCDNVTGIGCEKKRSFLTGAVIVGPIGVISGSGISLTGDAVLGDALRSTLISTESIVVQPGETLKFEVKVKPPKLATKAKKLNVVLKSFGTEVANKEIEVEDPKVSAAAVDVNVDQDIIDIYNLILTKEKNGHGKDEYLFEVSINKIHERSGVLGFILPDESTVFTEMYGPYSVSRDNSLIFAHQLGYESNLYQGKHRVVVTLYENNKDILSSDFEVDLN